MQNRFFRDWHRAEYYNARNYDQMTGRFMQTDPVFAERAGFDSYDPYSYVASNPVNFTDPTGESWLSQRAKGIGGPKFWKDFKQALPVIAYVGFTLTLFAIAGGPAALLGALQYAGIGAAIGLAGGGALGYAFGGLKKSRLNKLNWNDERAKEYAKKGAEVGAVAGFGAGMGFYYASEMAIGVAFGWQVFAGASYSATVLGAAYNASLSDVFDGLKQIRYNERKPLSKKGTKEKMLSEYDYNGDGHMDIPELYVASKTGLRKSQVDMNHDGRASNVEGLIYAMGRNNFGPDWDKYLMYLYANGIPFGM